MVSDTITEIAPSAQNKKIVIIHNQEKQLPNVMADGDKVKEVLFNVLGNAIKYTPENGKITITYDEDTSSVIVHITDTGTGIRQEDMPKLFQKFGIIENNYLNRQNFQGTGLGLYISKSIINL